MAVEISERQQTIVKNVFGLASRAELTNAGEIQIYAVRRLVGTGRTFEKALFQASRFAPGRLTRLPRFVSYP